MNILKALLTGVFAVSVCIAQGGSGSATMKDMDGNVYKTVKIGNQIWTAENLRTTKYNDGTAIPLVTDSAAWNDLSTPGYCYYNNDSTNANKYGMLYNWYTVNTGMLAPKGWHVPSDEEWTTLMGEIGNSLPKNNSSGFSALLGGERSHSGKFSDQRHHGLWWSDSKGSSVWDRCLGYDVGLLQLVGSNKSCGFSVRLVRDN